MTQCIGRRDFLRNGLSAATAAMGFPHIVPSSAIGAGGQTPPSERIAMGCVGVGSMGGGHLRSFLGKDDVRVVAACDLRKKFRERAEGFAEQRYGDSSGFQTYHDYREMLARDDIDAVCIATPEHWHGLVAIEAARRCKDMYMEKPVDVHVSIAKALRDTVNRYGVVFQFGTQQRSGREFRLACELVRNERIGKLHTVVAGSMQGARLDNQVVEPAPPKEEFDYDMWLGPAPWSAYSFQRSASRAEGSPGYWMHIHDYGLGCLSGAWGIHHVDIAQWGLDADDTGPVEVEGTGEIPQDGLCDTPVHWRVEHKYANGVRMIHADRQSSLAEFPQFDNDAVQYKGVGILFLGSEGWVLVWRGGIDAHPKSLLDTSFGPNEVRLPVSNDHRGNFLDCVRTRQRPVSPIEAAVRSDTVCHLDDIAIRLGRKLRWNPDLEEFVNDDEANRMLSRPMRSPWHL